MVIYYNKIEAESEAKSLYNKSVPKKKILSLKNNIQGLTTSNKNFLKTIGLKVLV